MKEVLQALSVRPMTPAILARNIGVEQEVLGEMVTGLIANDLIEEDGAKLVITASGIKFLNMAEQPVHVEQGSIAELCQEEVFELDIPEELENQTLVPTEIQAALANLSSALTKREIQNLPTKLAVLERLSEILDPSIALVLADIKRDLKVAA